MCDFFSLEQNNKDVYRDISQIATKYFIQVVEEEMFPTNKEISTKTLVDKLEEYNIRYRSVEEFAYAVVQKEYFKNL